MARPVAAGDRVLCDGDPANATIPDLRAGQIYVVDGFTQVDHHWSDPLVMLHGIPGAMRASRLARVHPVAARMAETIKSLAPRVLDHRGFLKAGFTSEQIVAHAAAAYRLATAFRLLSWRKAA